MGVKYIGVEYRILFTSYRIFPHHCTLLIGDKHHDENLTNVESIFTDHLIIETLITTFTKFGNQNTALYVSIYLLILIALLYNSHISRISKS